MKLAWLPKAQRSLREIRQYIALDNPKAARVFIKKLKATAGRLKSFPEAGWMLEDFESLGFREIVHDNYRIIYRIKGDVVEIANVLHGARILRRSDLKDE